MKRKSQGLRFIIVRVELFYLTGSMWMVMWV